MRGAPGAARPIADNLDMNAQVTSTPLTYEQAGVQYDLIDPVKVSAQRAAAETAGNLVAHGFSEVLESRGESAYVVDVGPFYLASIVECLGSKSLVADAMQTLTGRSYYDWIAQDTIAMAVNDLITVGAKPLVVQAYWAAGDSDWFEDQGRAQALIQGWKKACDTCGVAWGGGETPALAGIVEGGHIDLAANCTGIIQPKSRLSVGQRLQAGDAIVMLAASGIHANGLSLARKLAERLPQGYLSDIGNGQSYGEALLVPTPLYAPVTEALHATGVDVHYAANITGHGWRKLMRHPGAFVYRVDTLGPLPAILSFIQKEAGMDDEEAYGTLNMGAGFAVFVPPEQAQTVIDSARHCGIEAWRAGTVESGSKQVLIEPLKLRFAGDTLQLR